MDAELYLRLAGERALVAGSNPHHHGPSGLLTAAQALVAVGAIKAKVAQRVTDDYALASSLRRDGAHSPPFAYGREARDAKEPYAPRRIVPCDVELDLPAGRLRVHHIRLAEDSVDVAATLDFSTPLSHGHNVLMYGGGPHSLTVRDDRGNQVGTDFSGGGSDTTWEGTFSGEGTLAADAAYLEIDGVRVDLDEGAPGLEARIEDLPSADPALRHLWGSVATTHSMHGGVDVESAIDALVAAGALDPDHPDLPSLREVASPAMPHRGGGNPLPEPWRSLQRWGGGAGPVGVLIVGATPPVFDGVALAINTLRSSADEWSLDVETTPDIGMHWQFDGGDVNPRMVAWWAADDRGHHYLGEVGSWGGGTDSGRGSISFEAALDPKATSLDLMPTGPTQRAVIRVPLAW